MTYVAHNVCSYRDVEVDREVVAVALGNQHYLVLLAGGTSMCEVRRYRENRLELNKNSTLKGGVSLHRVKHLAQLVMRRADAGAEAVFRGVLDPHWDAKPRAIEPVEHPQLQVDEEFMDRLREHMTPNVEAALRAAIAHAHNNVQARSYANGLPEALGTYGPSGVKLQVAYLVLNLRSWKGGEAQRAKQTLNKWANK